MSHSYQALRGLPDDALIHEYNREASSVQANLSMIGAELQRRELDRQNTRMIGYAHQVRDLTIVITVLTVINVNAVVLSLF